MYEYNVIERCIDTNGKHFYGNLILPDTGKDEKLPLIIFSHEFNCRWTRGLKYGKELAPHGYAVYAFDFCGDHKDSQSSGEMKDMSVVGNAEDLRDVFDVAKRWEEIDPERIILMGGSQGGYATTIATGTWGLSVAALLLLYPGFCMPDALTADFATIDDLPTVYEADWIDFTMGRKYFADIFRRDPYLEARNVKCPVLLLQGSEDDWVPPRYAIQAEKEFPNAELKIYDGAKHIFQGDYMMRAVDDCLEFLKEHNL